jgi:hypothetical protein
VVEKKIRGPFIARTEKSYSACSSIHGLCFHACHSYPELMDGFLEVDELSGKPALVDVKWATKFYLGNMVQFLSIKRDKPLQ